jgi:ribosomal-protein-serine acetyltransferase
MEPPPIAPPPIAPPPIAPPPIAPPPIAPPPKIDAGELVLQRWEARWADELAVAVRESLPELKPFLPWASDGYDLEAARGFLAMAANGWTDGTQFNYAMFPAGELHLVGCIGLMTRMGPGILEIGYWMRTSYAGRGYMTTAVRAVTDVALDLPGVERVAIRYDEANKASAAVAVKAGFALVERQDREPEAPGETRVLLTAERRRVFRS